MDSERKKKAISTFLPQDKGTLHRAVSQLGVDLILRSTIYLDPQFAPWPRADWVFFQSPKAVKLLETSSEILANVSQYKVAAIAPATAVALEKLGVHVSFTGSGSETKITAKAFLDQVKNSENILMLTGDKTVATIVNYLPEQQVEQHKWYKSKLSMYDLGYKVLFLHATSPSQVEGLKPTLKKNKESQYIAIGSTTSKRLELEGIKAILPNDFSEIALLQAIESILSNQ